jgi:hypothetical protein
MANPSRFAGQYNAAEYAFGNSGSQAQAINIDGPVAVGANGAVVAFGYSSTGDGQIFYPLNTNAPVTVGSGLNAETVTPSAVSAVNAAYDSMSFTATFANVHGRGDAVASATFGLQEALNAAAAAGGGSVVVDARWSKLGGTSAILAAATVPSSVAVVDVRGGSGSLQTATFPISNALTKTLFSVGVPLLPTPGVGNMWEIDSIVVENVFLTAAFAAGGAIQASYGAGVTTPASATIPAAFLTGPTANQVVKVMGVVASTLASTTLNIPVRLAAATADFTTGAGSLIVKVSYRLLTAYV